MSILTVTNLEKSYGTDLLFSEVNFAVAAGQKLGLVGRNGCGKTTLLRILLGQELPDTGRAALASGHTLGYLRQEAPVHPEHSIIEEARSVFAPVRKLEAALQHWEEAMGSADTDDALEAAMEAYSHAREAFEAAGGYRHEADVPQVLEHLGFSPADYDKRVGACSGGEQTRLALAKIVLSSPDLLILDEPTNHLSVKETDKVIGFVKGLKSQGLTGIFISHNMQHVFQSCDRVVAMARGEIVFDRPVAETTLEDVHEHL